MAEHVTVVEHPLVGHKLTQMRRKETPNPEFRRLLREIGPLLAYEATRDLPTEDIEIETPMNRMIAPRLDGDKLALISILRAGNGLLDGIMDMMPFAPIGHVGLYRDHDTLEAIQYYFKVPDGLTDRLVIVVDPMLATGNSATAAIARLKEAGAVQVRFVCLLAAPEGVKALTTAHPDVPIVTAAIDERLDERGYILPGLGDAGDRLYGTE